MKPSSIELLLVMTVVSATLAKSSRLSTRECAVALTALATRAHVEVPVAITAFGLSEENAFVGGHHAPEREWTTTLELCEAHRVVAELPPRRLLLPKPRSFYAVGVFSFLSNSKA